MYSKSKSNSSRFANSLFVSSALFFGLTAIPTTDAAQESFSMDVRAQVIGNCFINTATDIDFGFLVAGTQASHDLVGTITYTCTPGNRGRISIDGGSTTNNMLGRAMASSSAVQIPYQIYTDDTYTTVWGDGSAGTEDVRTRGGRGLPRSRDLEFYVRINDTDLTGTDSGSYLDIITVTFDF